MERSSGREEKKRERESKEERLGGVRRREWGGRGEKERMNQE